MRALQLLEPKTALVCSEVQLPSPRERELLVEISACGVCHTDLHVVDGELVGGKLPVIPGP